MFTVTKRFTFEAAHRLPDYNGKCTNLHGHRWELEVEVEGLPNNFNQTKPYKGILIDFGDLKRIVKENIIDHLDHSYINKFCSDDRSEYLYCMDAPHIVGNPTCENLVSWIQRVLFTIFSRNLVRVRLYETKDSYAEWRRDDN